MKYHLTIFLLLSSFLLSTVQAKTFALVIGINDYDYVEPLDGAVSDANDIYNALKANAVAANNIHFLTNKKASKSNIQAAWNSMVSQSSAGDTLLVTYAGHGSQITDTNGDEADGEDEVFLLSGFREAGVDAFDNLISDDEWYRWFKTAKGRQVVFVADSCHSGTMHRSVTPLKKRYQKISTEVIAPPEHAVYKEERENQNYVTFFAASTEDMDTYERRINGKPRGALSYAFAKAIRGAADDGDGTLKKQELEVYLFNTITELTSEGNNKQVPQFIPEGFNTKDLFALNRSGASSAASNSFDVYFSRGNTNHSGSNIQLNITKPRYQYLTLYNIAGDNSIQFLYPILESDSPQIATNKPFILKFNVDQIQGGEQLVAILSTQRLSKLHGFLKRSNGEQATSAFDQNLSHLLANEKYDIKRVQHIVKN